MASLSIQDPSSLSHRDQGVPVVVSKDELQNGGISTTPSVDHVAKKLQDDLESLGHRIKEHEDNLKFLKNEKTHLEDSILDMQVILCKFHSSSGTTSTQFSNCQTEEQINDLILRYDKSAAGLLCQMTTRYAMQASHLTFSKDVIGILCTLGKVDDDNLSRLFSEFLGFDTMMAVVCKTYEGVKSLEIYDKEGHINKSSGIHGLGGSIGRHLAGRFRVICLENLRPYAGEFINNDPQKRLDILKPRLPTGECPPGFLGFAVNMINVDITNLFCVTPRGFGLRETLFYSLFSHTHVYRTRVDMMNALPCLRDGALSLDGGIIKQNGVYSLGDREDVDLRFGVGSMHSNLPQNYVEIENLLRVTKWKKEKQMDDIKREQSMLDHVKFNFEIKKQDFVKFLAERSCLNQQPQQGAVGREKMTPRC